MPELTTEFYRERAAEARRFAAKATDPADREIYQRIATSYETLVERGVSPPLRLVGAAVRN